MYVNSRRRFSAARELCCVFVCLFVVLCLLVELSSTRKNADCMWVVAFGANSFGHAIVGD